MKINLSSTYRILFQPQWLQWCPSWSSSEKRRQKLLLKLHPFIKKFKSHCICVFNTVQNIKTKTEKHSELRFFACIVLRLYNLCHITGSVRKAPQKDLFFLPFSSKHLLKPPQQLINRFVYGEQDDDRTDTMCSHQRASSQAVDNKRSMDLLHNSTCHYHCAPHDKHTDCHSDSYCIVSFFHCKQSS